MVDGREKDEAFVTLATNDTYALGCLVVGSSLRRVATTRQLVVMITDGVSPSMRNQLGGLFDHTISVNLLDSTDTANLELLGRPDLSVTFTKLQCWRLTQFKKCVFLDADTLVIQNVDELFDREELSAAPDSGWPDCFNSGVFVYVPSDETYRNLLTFAITTGSFDGGDQGLLNLFFSSWATEDIGKHLPFTYNVVSQAFYSYLPALKQFHENVKVVHFIGPVKPWHHAYNTATGLVTQLPNTGNNQEFLQTWWDIFMDSVQPHLDPLINVFVRIEHRAPSPVHDSPQAASEVYQTNQDNSHHHHHQDHHGHGDIRAQPTITYQVVYPYTPPELDKPHHDVSPESKPYHEDSSQSNIVEVPVVYRDYKSFEAHYMEEPFSSVNPELPPIEHYTASVEIQGPAFVYGEGGDNNNSNQSGPAQEDIVNVKNQGGHLDEIIAQVDSVESSGEVHVAGLTEDGADEVRERPVSDDKDDENGNISEKGGIVGDLANLTLADDGGPAKNDRERRLQWEQGQADYMGVDRFDNIKARLDEKITGASGSQTVVEDEVRSSGGDDDGQSVSLADSYGVTLANTSPGGVNLQDSSQQFAVSSQAQNEDDISSGHITEATDLLGNVEDVASLESHSSKCGIIPVSEEVTGTPKAEAVVQDPTPEVIVPAPTLSSPSLINEAGTLVPLSEGEVSASTPEVVGPVLTSETVPDPTPEVLAPAPTLEAVAPAPTPEAVAPAPTPEAVATTPTSEAVEPAPTSEPLATAPTPEPVATAPTPEPVATASTPEAVAPPAPTPEAVAPPAPTPEAVAPPAPTPEAVVAPTPEAVATAPTPEAVATAPTPEEVDPALTSDAVATAPTPEEVDPALTSDAVATAPTPEEVDPALTSDAVAPTLEAVDIAPTPEAVAAAPTPEAVAAAPTPEAVAAAPTPEAVAAAPTPEAVAAAPTPEAVAAAPEAVAAAPEAVAAAPEAVAAAPETVAAAPEAVAAAPTPIAIEHASTHAAFSPTPDVVFPAPTLETIAPAPTPETIAPAPTPETVSPAPLPDVVTPSPTLDNVLPIPISETIARSITTDAATSPSVSDKSLSLSASPPTRSSSAIPIASPTSSKPSSVPPPVSPKPGTIPPQTAPKPSTVSPPKLSKPNSVALPTSSKPSSIAAPGPSKPSSIAPPVAPKPNSAVPTTSPKPNSAVPTTSPKQNQVATPTSSKPNHAATPTNLKLSPTSLPSTSPKPILIAASPQKTKVGLPVTQTPEPTKLIEAKPKPTPFSFKEKEPAPPPPSKPSSATGSLAPKPGTTPTDSKPQLSTTEKPISPSSATTPKPSFITNQASRFEKPAPATTGTAAPKSASTFAKMASRFESPAPPKPQPVGSAVKSPPVLPASPQSTVLPTPSNASQPASSGPATNREEMLSRFGVKLPPPKK